MAAKRKGKQSWRITEHAIDRYIDRFEPQLGKEEARTKVGHLLLEARVTRNRTAAGHMVWQTGEVRFVMKPARENETLLCVTILSLPEWETLRAEGRPKNDPVGGLAALQAFLGIVEE